MNSANESFSAKTYYKINESGGRIQEIKVDTSVGSDQTYKTLDLQPGTPESRGHFPLFPGGDEE